MEAAAPLAKFGIQLAGATGFVWVYPLLVYFDPKKHAEAIVTLMPKAIRHELLTKVHLEICFVDVTGRGVQWPAKPGLLSDIGEALGHWLGTPIHLFETNDLQTVLTLANL